MCGTKEPEDAHMKLQSCHPKHSIKSILHSQALRIKRICSNEQTTKKRLGELKCYLKKRGFNNASIDHCFNKYTVTNIKKRTRTTECHLSSHTIMRSVIYPTSFVSTGQPYKNTQNCAKSSKNHPSWPSGNPKVWKSSWWELTSPLDLPTMVSVKNVIRDNVWP